MKTNLKLALPIIIFCFGNLNCFDVFAQIPVKYWDKTFGGTGIDHLLDGIQTNDGGFIFGGPTNSGLGGDKTEPSRGGTIDFWIIKTDPNGNKLWDKTIGSADGDDLRTICQTADGGYLLGGSTDGLGISGDKTLASHGLEDMWIVRTDSNGNKLWDKTFGGSQLDRLFSLKQTADGGFLLAGCSSSPISGNKTAAPRAFAGSTFDFWVVKIDSVGNKLWDKAYGGNGSEGLYDMILTSDGGFILAGSSTSGSSHEKSRASYGAEDYWVVKADASGNMQWENSFGGNDDDICWSVKQTSDGGYILGGHSQSNANGTKSQASIGFQDFWVVKLNAAGVKIWDKTFGTNRPDLLTDIIEMPDGGFLLGGHTDTVKMDGETPVINADFWGVKINSAGNYLWDHRFGGENYDWGYFLISLQGGDFIIAGGSASTVGRDKSQPCQGNSDYWIIKAGEAVTGVKNNNLNNFVKISPNPSNGTFQIQLNNLKASNAELQLTDLLGRTILSKQITTTHNQVSEQISLSGAKGMYLLQIKAGGQTVTRKIIVE